MKAIRASIYAEQKVRYEEYEVPDKPTGTDALVKLDRTIISAGTELANYIGLDPDTRIPGRWCAYPWLPGYGGVGRVVAVGPDVKNIQVGQRVYGIFHHANYEIIDTANRVCVPVPEALDSTTAVMGRMCGVAITGYQRTRGLTLGDTIVIIGLGLVGNLGGQFYLNAGQRVIGIDMSEKRRTLARQVGFTEVLDPLSLSEDALWERVYELNGGARPPVIVDAVGDSKIVEQVVQRVANNGQVIMLGTPRAPYQTDGTIMLKYAHFHGVEIIGALEWLVPLLKKQSPGITTERNAELIFQLLCDGKLQVKPLLSHVLPPAKLNDAYQGLLHQKDAYLGVVLDWENNPLPPVG